MFEKYFCDFLSKYNSSVIHNLDIQSGTSVSKRQISSQYETQTNGESFTLEAVFCFRGHFFKTTSFRRLFVKRSDSTWRFSQFWQGCRLPGVIHIPFAILSRLSGTEQCNFSPPDGNLTRRFPGAQDKNKSFRYQRERFVPYLDCSTNRSIEGRSRCAIRRTWYWLNFPDNWRESKTFTKGWKRAFSEVTDNSWEHFVGRNMCDGIDRGRWARDETGKCRDEFIINVNIARNKFKINYFDKITFFLI